ncbi:hypothetical protein [Rhodococcus sp. ACS1]|uniref:hypothetical protein n=1 Tax=Rhodococcus sp. ACS1 TaxID=2028570 RepID=UPI001C52B66E
MSRFPAGTGDGRAENAAHDLLRDVEVDWSGAQCMAESVGADHGGAPVLVGDRCVGRVDELHSLLAVQQVLEAEL